MFKKSGRPKTTRGNIIDVEEVIINWVKAWFDEKERHQLEKQYKDLKWEKMTIDIDNSKFFIETDPPLHAKETSAVDVGPRNHVLFRSSFKNPTSEEQEFHFETTRSTRSSLTCTINNGFTYGAEFELSLGIPGIEALEASMELSTEFNFEKSNEEVKEKEMNWSVSTKIRVPKNKMAIAELVMKEDEYKGTFTARSYFRGKFFVNIYKDSAKLCRIVGKDLRHIFTEELGFKHDRQTGEVYFETRGVCNARFGIEQEVEVREVDLPDGNSPSR